MAQSESSGWWERWFKRRPASRPPSRQSQPARQARRKSTPPAASTGQPGPSAVRDQSAPPAASCPAIVIQQASSGESRDLDWSEQLNTPGPSGVRGTGGTGGTDGTASPPTGTSGVRPSDEGPSDAGPSGVGPSGAGPSSMRSSESGLATADEAETGGAEANTQQSEPDVPLTDVSPSAASSGFERANRVVLRTESVTEATVTGGSVTEATVTGGDGRAGDPSQTPTPAEPNDADVEKMRTEIGECHTVIQGVTSFSYETKETTKISGLAAEGEKLLQLWREALDKKDVLAQVTRECTEAANQSGERLSRDVRELEELYGELAEALANLQRTTSRHKAVKKDIKAMKKVVGNASVKEQVEVGKVAAQHEKEVYAKWQSLKGLPPDVEALEKLRKELTDKQRAISGLDSLVQRRLEQVQRSESTSRDETYAAGQPADSGTNRTAGKGIPQRVPPSPGRRSGASRTSGKRKQTDEARQERKASTGGQRNQLVMRNQGAATASGGGGGGGWTGVVSTDGGSTGGGWGGSSSGAAAGVATQSGFLPGQYSPGPVSVYTSPISTIAGRTSTTATSSSMPPPPPPPPPPAAAPMAHLLRVAAEDEDSGAADSGADETSTSNDEDGTALDVDEAVLAAVFPLHFGPAMFDGLDPADAARAMADAMNFH